MMNALYNVLRGLVVMTVLGLVGLGFYMKDQGQPSPAVAAAKEETGDTETDLVITCCWSNHAYGSAEVDLGNRSAASVMVDTSTGKIIEP